MAERVSSVTHEPVSPIRPFEATIDLYDLNDKLCRADDPEFLDKLLVAVQERLDAYKLGVSADEVVFSGIDGSQFRQTGQLYPEDTVFGMNATGWRTALEAGIFNPGYYADDAEVPCIAVYDGRQLKTVYGADHIGLEDLAGDRVRLQNIELGEPIKPDFSQTEAVAHVDYPNKQPRDALLGVFFIQE